MQRRWDIALLLLEDPSGEQPFKLNDSLPNSKLYICDTYDVSDEYQRYATHG